MSSKNYASRVPKYRFSSTLEEQERELANNPLVTRMAESRKVLSDDPFRPIYHYVNPENTLNDPNGLCFWQGRWHLFYQGYPPEDPRQHWGHAVSDDLVHWRDLPYAIYPDPEEKCFSGATLVEEERVIAMYHGTEAGNMIAISRDPLLLNWDKLTGQPVIKLHPEGFLPDVRVFDPCIWKKGDYYYSLSGGTLPHEPSGRRTRANFLFRSDDLIKWKYLHPFIEGDRFTLIGDDGACPYFWPIGDRHILLFFSHMSGGQALVGDYDEERDKFVVTSHHDFNFGPYGPSGVHAPSATPDGSGEIVAIFNMNPGIENHGWNQIMSLPRRLSLMDVDPIGKDLLKIVPAGDIESLRGEHRQIKNLNLPINRELLLDEIGGNAVEIVAEIDTNNAPMVELNVFRSPAKEEFTRISFYRNRGFRNWDRYDGWEPGKRLGASDSLICIDFSYSSELPDALSRAPETAPVFLRHDENLNLRIFLDKSVLEVFVSGKQCVAIRVYPSRADSTGISIRSQGTSARLVTFDIWQMRNIYQS
jgi:beta-fructofuranosidase